MRSHTLLAAALASAATTSAFVLPPSRGAASIEAQGHPKEEGGGRLNALPVHADGRVTADADADTFIVPIMGNGFKLALPYIRSRTETATNDAGTLTITKNQVGRLLLNVHVETTAGGHELLINDAVLYSTLDDHMGEATGKLEAPVWEQDERQRPVSTFGHHGADEEDRHAKHKEHKEQKEHKEHEEHEHEEHEHEEHEEHEKHEKHGKPEKHEKHERHQNHEHDILDSLHNVTVDYVLGRQTAFSDNGNAAALSLTLDFSGTYDQETMSFPTVNFLARRLGKHGNGLVLANFMLSGDVVRMLKLMRPPMPPAHGPPPPPTSGLDACHGLLCRWKAAFGFGAKTHHCGGMRGKADGPGEHPPFFPPHHGHHDDGEDHHDRRPHHHKNHPGHADHHHDGPPPHHDHDHHHHHQHHSRFVQMLADFGRFVLVPFLIGYAGTMVAALLGYAVGKAVVFLWRLAFRRQHKAVVIGQCRRDTKAAAVEKGADEEKAGLMAADEQANDDLPPYVDEAPKTTEV